MLRHMRSVHSKTKGFSCSTCERVFSRKDTLERHFLEQHVFNYRIPCKSCGRWISNRGFNYHLDSQVCKTSRAALGNGRFDTLGHLLPNEDQDCFLLAMRVLRTWKDQCDLNPDQELVCQPLTVVSVPKESRERLLLEAQALTRFHLTMSSAAGRIESLKSYCTALALCFTSFARFHSQLSGLLEWAIHIRGAHHLLAHYHNAKCSCSSGINCLSLREMLRQDPALSILKRTVESGGFNGLRFGMLGRPSKPILKLLSYENFEHLHGVFYDWLHPNDL